MSQLKLKPSPRRLRGGLIVRSVAIQLFESTSSSYAGAMAKLRGSADEVRRIVGQAMGTNLLTEGPQRNAEGKPLISDDPVLHRTCHPAVSIAMLYPKDADD